MDELLPMLGIVSFVLYGYLLLPVFLLTLLAGYVLLRVRDARTEERDPDIGIKAALHYFLSLSILLIVNGLTLVAVEAMTSKPTKTERVAPGGGFRNGPAIKEDTSATQRTGWGLAAAGLLLSLLHFGVLKGTTNDDRRPAARHLFLGWRFAIHGLVLVITVTALVVTLFQKDFGNATIRKTFFATLLIWGPSWVIHLLLLQVSGADLYRPRKVTLPPNPLGSLGADVDRPAERPVRAQEPPRPRPTSGPHCTHCNAPLTQREVDEGWCDSCGKKLPERLR